MKWTEDVQPCGLPLPPGCALVVSGAANWQVADRYLPPEVIAPLQVITAEGPRPCPWFDRYQAVGVSSLVPLKGDSSVIYTTGADLARLQRGGSVISFDVPDLDDVHELTLVPEGVLLANTGRDEAVMIDPDSGRVIERLDLTPLRGRGRPPRLAGGNGMASFHLNQVFYDRDRLLGLVHHIEGFRLFFHTQRRLTGHGSGGVLDLRTGWRQDLRLHAPHTARPRPGGWLVLNSGRKELSLLRADWAIQKVIPLSGWGRGGALSDDGQVFFAGISSVRRRYARPGDSRWTGIEAVDLTTEEHWCLELPDIEQVNAVELCSIEVANWLLELPPAPATARREAASNAQTISP